MQLPNLKIGNLKPKFPIIQGGMAVRVSTASLAGAVAKEGGIGVIGATGMSVKELIDEIRKARCIAESGIIGVNIMYAARQFSNLVEAAINEKIDAIFTGAGFSRDIFRQANTANIPVIPIVSSARAARLAEKSGAAAIVAEGVEAGGHLGTDKSIKQILPEILKTVNIPVIAAGGIVNGQDMADMVKLGADGVQMATRFVLSEECSVADEFKQTYLNAQENDVITIKSPVGLPGRAIKNPFTELLSKGQSLSPQNCVNCLKECSREYCIMDALVNSRNGSIADGVVFAGINVHKIKDILPVPVIFQRLLQEFSTV